MSTSPRIYVASLADYNAGELHGAWIDADQDADAIEAQIATMLRGSKHPNVTVGCPDCDRRNMPACDTCKGMGQVPSAEDWAIHDYEGFAGIKLSEGHDLEEVAALAELIEDQDDEDLIEAAADVSDDTTADTLRTTIEDRFRGVYDSEEDYAAEMVEDCYGDVLKGLPSLIAGHIDYEGIARDMRLGGDVTFVRLGGRVYVFDNNG